MISIKNILFLVIGFLFLSLHGQELPPIKNYDPLHYKAENQNWALSQSPDKHIYIANNKGLLAYNGASWELYNSPNETIMRSVLALKDRVYTGCYMEFGYWVVNNVGELIYTSISKKLKLNLLEDEEFWNIKHLEDWILFQSLNRIYIYHTKDESVNIISSEDKIPRIFKVGNSIYFQKINEGVFKIASGKEVLLIDNAVFKENEIDNMFGSENDLLILTKSQGFYNYKEGALKKWPISADQELLKVNIYNSIQLQNRGFALGTIANGLFILDNKGNLSYRIDRSNGLQNNTVLALYEDHDKNIWTGLDMGISYVNMNTAFKVYHDYSGNIGSVYAIEIHDGYLYMGTNQGLFYKELRNKQNPLKFIKGTEGQVWSLKVIDNTLFCGHNSGTFTIAQNKAVKIPNTVGTWKINALEQSNFLLQGNYDGLYILEKINTNWRLRNKIKGFNNSARYFEQLGNKIFVNHEYRGVFKLTVANDYTQFTAIEIDTLIKGHDSGILKYDHHLLYAYAEGIYKYNLQKDGFLKDTILSNLYKPTEYVSGKLILDAENNLWAFTNKNISYARPGKLSNKTEIKTIPLTKEVRQSITGYENMLSIEDEQEILLGTNTGYISIDRSKLKVNDFNVFISTVTNGSKSAGSKTLVNKDVAGDFKDGYNNLAISFYVPEFNKLLQTEYQYQLMGLYDDWREWSEKSNVIFENLPHGDYTFNVRAKIGEKISSNVATYQFSIARPWYISNVMLLLYALGILLFSILMHNVYKRHYRKKEEELIKENKRQIALNKAQNEKELIEIQNEQLQKDIQNKSKELAASTMSVVKKNELLNTIREQLVKIKNREVIDPVLKIIDKSLNHNDNWKLFKEAFDNVDRKFLKKLKKLHPNLTPNDVKLCAYLRLNLSSKEIAPLFNISPRSVEIKRYRLRKKMNLEHDENLVNYILEL